MHELKILLLQLIISYLIEKCITLVPTNLQKDKAKDLIHSLIYMSHVECGNYLHKFKQS